MKRILIIIGVIVIVVGIGVLLYIFTRPSTPSVATTTQTTQTGSLPGAPNQNIASSSTTTVAGSSTPSRFGVISNDPAIAYYVDAENNATIVEPNGLIETIINGQGTVINSSTAENIINASFSFDGKKLLINFGNVTNPQTGVFDLASRTWTGLPQGMMSPVWSPSNYQIAYLTSAANSTENIAVLNVAVKNARPSTLSSLGLEDMTLQWPNKNTLVISDKPSAYTVGSAWLFTIPTKALTPAAYEFPGMESIWSNTTDTIGLVFSGNNNNQGGRVFLLNPIGSDENITFVTLPSKCTFNESGATAAITSSTLDLYCAVPRDQTTLSIARLPDEYLQKVIFTSDDFYAINTADGSLNSIFSDTAQNLDATALHVYNNTLFFINRYDEKLYGITLQ